MERGCTCNLCTADGNHTHFLGIPLNKFAGHIQHQTDFLELLHKKKNTFSDFKLLLS